MNKGAINKDDIIERVYFITKLVQNQKGTTMQGALTSKSDSMGGIFDRFINTISDSLVFEKIILPEIKTNKKIEVVNDYYFYDPKKSVSGIAPDIFGITVNSKLIPFTIFNNVWEPVKGMPQIEIKTFKAKDQMISLRNQGYSNYMIFVDLELRKDYLVPFLDSKMLNCGIAKKMQMNDETFIREDSNNKIKRIEPIDFSQDNIGNLKLIAITNATDFMKQSTLCGANTSVLRMKEIVERKTNIKSNLIHDKLMKYAKNSPRIKELYEYNNLWKKKMRINNNTNVLDFSASKIDCIEICKYNKDGIVITPLEEGCSFNGLELIVGKQYSVKYAILDRTGSKNSEYFMQKQCAFYLKGKEKELIRKLEKIIEKN